MFILKGIEQLEKESQRLKRSVRVSSSITSDAIAYRVQKVITRLSAAKTSAVIKRLNALARARKKGWFAITAQPL